MATNPVQTTYSLEPAVAVAGLIADTGFRDVQSRILEQAAGAAPGRLMVKGTGQDQVKLPTAAGDVTNDAIGFLVWNTMMEPNGFPTPGAAVWQDKDAVPVLGKGRIWVPVTGAATLDDGGVFVIHSGADAGTVRGTADASATVLGSSKVLRSGLIGGVSLVEINLP
jgi:hypothetical protein